MELCEKNIMQQAKKLALYKNFIKSVKKAIVSVQVVEKCLIVRYNLLTSYSH